MSKINLPSRTTLERGVIVSVALAAGGYLGFSVWIGWREVLGAFSSVGYVGAAIALMLSLVNYGLRFLRWQFYLRSLGCFVPFAQSGVIYFSGFALTTTPGKIGELLRSTLLERYNVPYSRSISALISERLCDVAALLLIGLSGVAIYPAVKPIAWVFLCGFFLLICFMLNTAWQERMNKWLDHKPNKFSNVARRIINTIYAARPCYRMKVLSIALPVSIAAWMAEAIAFHLLLELMHVPLSFKTSISIYALSIVVGGLSFLPGGLGSTEATMIALLLSCGLSAADATAVTLIIRLTTLWFAVFLGVGAAFLARKCLPSRIQPEQTFSRKER